MYIVHGTFLFGRGFKTRNDWKKRDLLFQMTLIIPSRLSVLNRHSVSVHTPVICLHIPILINCFGEISGQRLNGGGSLQEVAMQGEVLLPESGVWLLV